MSHSFRTLQGARVAVRVPEPVAGHIANELGAILGEPRGSTSIEIAIREALGDGFAVRIDGSAIAVSGGTPRRAMDGVYWLLEAAGAVFPEPGVDLPLVDRERELTDGHYEVRPRFPKRTLILGSDGFHDDWRGWLTWASRNRYDDIFFHDTPPSRAGRGGPRPDSYGEMAAAGGGWLFERWDADGADIVRAASERGMTLQFGGHHLATVLPRELFAEHPEWFPLRDGVRDGRHNVCTSNGEAMARIAEGTAAFVDRFEGADTYHLWADDIRGGGWCTCEGCAELSPADQALRMTNAMAAPLAKKGLSIAHLAYHDTLMPPERTSPAENVEALFAPRERCYAHAVDDENCERNRRDYWEPFAGLRTTFGDEPARISVFEYYSDAVLFKGLAPTHETVLPGDVDAYARANVGNLQNLMVGPRPWVGPPLHAWWFARTAYESPPWDGALQAFTSAAFPQCGHAARHYYGLQDESYRRLFDLHDLEWQMRRDVLDFSDQPRETMATKAWEALSAAAGLAARHQQLLKISSATPHERDRIARERVQAEYIASMARHLASRLSAWQLALDGRVAEARPRLAAAERALRELEQWTADHALPGYAVLAEGTLRGARRLTDDVATLL